MLATILPLAKVLAQIVRLDRGPTSTARLQALSASSAVLARGPQSMRPHLRLCANSALPERPRVLCNRPAARTAKLALLERGRTTEPHLVHRAVLAPTLRTHLQQVLLPAPLAMPVLTLILLDLALPPIATHALLEHTLNFLEQLRIVLACFAVLDCSQLAVLTSAATVPLVHTLARDRPTATSAQVARILVMVLSRAQIATREPIRMRPLPRVMIVAPAPFLEMAKAHARIAVQAPIPMMLLAPAATALPATGLMPAKAFPATTVMLGTIPH